MLPNKRKSRNCYSQPSTSTNVTVTQNDKEYFSNTQVSPNDTITNQQYARHVGNVVKYILAADRSKIPIARIAISKAVNCQGKDFRAVMKTANEVLEDVFGYKLIDIENGKYILCNMIKNELPHLRFDKNTNNRYILLFLTLLHIYMSGEICTEDSLIDFLTNLDIINDGNMVSEIFGNVLELITVTFVKEKYIEIEKTDNENCERELKWGIRAHKELSIRSIMEFMSEIYGNIDMKSWPQQYEDMLRKEREAEAAAAEAEN